MYNERLSAQIKCRIGRYMMLMSIGTTPYKGYTNNLAISKLYNTDGPTIR